MKTIEFYPCGYKGQGPAQRTYAECQAAIRAGAELIRTESMTHLAFGLVDKGYCIILCGERGERNKIYPGMNAPDGRPLNRGHNVAKALLQGRFDKWIFKER